jgi:outer membrane cobalamin receptor
MLKDDFSLRDKILGNITAEYEILKGLKYSLRLSMDYINGRDYLFTPTYNISNSDVGQNLKARLGDSRFTNVSTIIENILTYKKSFGKHEFDLLAAYSRQKDNNESLHIEVQDFPNNNLRVVSAANDIRNRSGFSFPRRISSAFGRLNYSYAGKYLLSASIRRDGSSNFGPQHRYGVFPSASVGWNVAEEDFFNVEAINGFKIRASYGVLGSDNL